MTRDHHRLASIALLVLVVAVVAAGAPSLACLQCDDNECESGYFAGAGHCYMRTKYCPVPGKPGQLYPCGEACTVAGNCVLWIVASSVPVDDVPRRGSKGPKGGDDGMSESPSDVGDEVWVCAELADDPEPPVPLTDAPGVASHEP